MRGFVHLSLVVLIVYAASAQDLGTGSTDNSGKSGLSEDVDQRFLTGFNIDLGAIGHAAAGTVIGNAATTFGGNYLNNCNNRGKRSILMHKIEKRQALEDAQKENPGDKTKDPEVAERFFCPQDFFNAVSPGGGNNNNNNYCNNCYCGENRCYQQCRKCSNSGGGGWFNNNNYGNNNYRPTNNNNRPTNNNNPYNNNNYGNSNYNYCNTCSCSYSTCRSRCSSKCGNYYSNSQYGNNQYNQYGNSYRPRNNGVTGRDGPDSAETAPESTSIGNDNGVTFSA